jgi:hypothetical protein
MRVTIFKNIKSTSAGFVRNVDEILGRIKEGSSAEIVNNIRAGNKEQKMKLPAICFSGEFRNRSKSGLVKPSGLICLDFDKVPSIEELNTLRETLVGDEYTYACFVSPSGNGLKVLVKIPPTIDEHKLYFDGLKNYYKSEYFDVATSDISRVCFESYDPNLYINKKSKAFLGKEEPAYSHVGHTNPDIPETKSYVIIKNLLKWWEAKFPMAAGQRNENLIKLAFALNDFGINKDEARVALMDYATESFPESEITVILNSGYSKIANFGTRHFEDTITKKKIEEDIKRGGSISQIKTKYKDIENIELAVMGVKDTITTDEFWYYDKNGKCHLVHHKFKAYLEDNQIFKYYQNETGFFFVKIIENMVSIITPEQIKDFVLDDVHNRESAGMLPYEMMAGATRYFKDDYLSFLGTIDLKIKEDTRDACYLYYRNCVLEITKNAIKEISYVDLDGFVWQNRIIDRDFERNSSTDGMYKDFIYLLAGKDEARNTSIKSVIGYMLHSYKTHANNKAIILNDEVISENPNGGSGKGIFVSALGKIKRVSVIDGKMFDFDKPFPYQTVGLDCQALIYDDIKKNFYFERLFSVITEGITIEKKNKDAIKVDVKNSPKILITTNYTVGGVGGSFERRKFELEFSSHFGSHHTPEDEFGCMLFDDWDAAEWQRFDCFMIECLTLYLNEGLVKADYQNLPTRKFIKETSFEFWEWCKDDANIKRGERIYNKTLHGNFIDEYPDYKRTVGGLTHKRFSQWVVSYCKFHNLKYTKDRDMTGSYIEIEGDAYPF